MRNLCTAKKPLLYSQPPPRHPHFLLLLLLVPLFLTFFLLYPRPLPPQRPIQPPDLSHCLLISIYSPSSPPLNCCALSLVSPDPQILNFTFPLPSSPLRIRPAAHLVDSRYISQYSRAVQLMKDLPKSDPRSFFQQANIHCAYCNGAYDQLGFSNLRLLIHRSWLFFPWHRLYLYFHERILAKLIGDDSFALPFWNWDSPDGMRIPSMYLNNIPINTSSSSSSSSSLYHPNRDPSHQPPVMVDLNFPEDGNNVGSDQAVVYPSVDDNLRIMYRQMMENGATTELFLGSAFRAGEQPEPGPGSVEVIPHNTVHSWTGDPRKQNREDMGAFYSAARDPIFFAHHANIDRLWLVWKSLGRKHKDFSDSDWLDSAFLFYDEEARLVRVKVRDCLDIDRLRYRYQQVENPWINSSGRSHATKNKKKSNNGSIDNNIHYNYAEELEFPVKVEKEAVVVRVKRPRRGGGEDVEVLVVDGIETDGTESTRFDVYVNASPAELQHPAARECAGSFVSLPRLKRGGKGRTNLKLGISELIEDLRAEGDDTVVVTLLPRKGKATVAEFLLRTSSGRSSTSGQALSCSVPSAVPSICSVLDILGTKCEHSVLLSIRT
ncbi:hypothetical protein M5K25_008959 [Dendrobium thyrsiflorum]|uniref:Tyrosinase copper-binding domain-containing protein n=1 Tax=Dendrobium thyrsiflorum TaxID=117978 RepID=A0ABD0VGR3_DENTH